MMSDLINSLSNTSDEIQIFLFTGILFLCWNIETIAGLTLGYKRMNHAKLNAKFILTNIPIQVLLGFAFTKCIQFTGHHHIGLLYHLPYMSNRFLLFIASFLLLDLGEYIYHLLMHKFKRLWMFHVVHHTDQVVDVSTTFREHPGENIIRNLMTLGWIFLGGVAFWPLLLRQLIQIVSNIFSHINYRLPEKIDSIIGWVFITPNLHHVHHHYMQPYTDCNYGDVLSIWDRLFGTFKRLRSGNVLFGVDTYMNEKEHSRYFALLKLPFTKYRKRINPEKF
jgi:sterol desaturase/sphingolipid hydroxylase (fatty acid hydroxylase superfamily)